MTTPVAVHGHEIADLVSAHPKGIRLSQLIDTATKRFGPSAIYHTSSRMGLDLDAMLVFLERRNRLRIVRGVVFPCGSMALSY
jgi:probable metal-binding protein